MCRALLAKSKAKKSLKSLTALYSYQLIAQHEPKRKILCSGAFQVTHLKTHCHGDFAVYWSKCSNI